MTRQAALRATTIVAALCATAAWSTPSDAESNFLGGIHFTTGLPQGALEDQLDRDAYGIDGQIFFAPSTSPFSIGLDVSWANYGTESRKEPFSTTIPDVTVDVDTMNNFVQTLMVFRGQFPSGPIQPYADAVVGFNYLYTETTINDDGWDFDSVASTTNQDDFAFAYGFGGGVMVPVWSGTGTESVQSVLIDAGARYVRGGEAEYLKDGSIRRTNGRVKFDTTESRTDMVRMQIGVVCRF